MDLPAPFGPMMATISCRATSRLTLSTIATTPPNDLRSSRASMMAQGTQPCARRRQRADDAAGKSEQQHEEHDAENSGQNRVIEEIW